MGSLTNYSEDQLLSAVLNTNYSPVATVYLALCTASPGEAATGASMSEVANSNGYARTAISFSAAASRRVTQSGAVTFPQASGSWGTVTDYAIVDSATHGAGNALAYGSFSASFAPVNGNTPSVASGQVYVEISATGGSDGLSDYLVHKLLDEMFRNVAYALPATYICLATATLTDSTTSPTEVSNSNNYARKLVNVNGGSSPTWTTVSGGAADNTHAITFATPSGSWGAVVAAFVADSGTYGVGNVLAYANSIVDQTPVANDTVTFPVGAFDWAIT